MSIFEIRINKCSYLMLCLIWYHLYNLENMKNTHGGMILLVKLQTEKEGSLPLLENLRNLPHTPYAAIFLPVLICNPSSAHKFHKFHQYIEILKAPSNPTTTTTKTCPLHLKAKGVPSYRGDQPPPVLITCGEPWL